MANDGFWARYSAPCNDHAGGQPNSVLAFATPFANASTSRASLYTYTLALAVAGTFNRLINGCAQ